MKTQEVLETLATAGIQTEDTTPEMMQNAAPMGTGKTNEGAELVPSETFSQTVFNSIPEYSSFIGALPGNHSAGGARLGKSVSVPVIGEAGLFDGQTEKTSGAFAVLAGGTVATDKVTISQARYVKRIDVTKELEQYADMPEALSAALTAKLGASFARTLDAAIINSDNTTAATGNVNSDDAAPAATSYYLKQATGLRKAAIDNGTATAVTALTFADFVTVMDSIGDYAAAPSDCMWLFNRSTYNKALSISEFLEAQKNGQGSTVYTGALGNILGSDYFIARDLGKTEADGKQSATPANNTAGQFLYFWKPAVQFGFGSDLKLKLWDFGSQGYQLEAWFDFGMGIAAGLATQTDVPVASGINVTL